MPGLTLAWRHRPERSGSRETDLVLPRQAGDYETRVFHASERLWLAASAYPDYPIDVHEQGPILTIVEGRFYGPASIGCASRAMLAMPPDTVALQRWLETVDGDFVLATIDRRDDRAALLNDRYGRLPLYLGRETARTVVSRELRLTAAARAHTRLDRAAVSQFLVFGYPLGDATLHEGVVRLAPATLLHGGGATARLLLTPRFDTKTEVPQAAEHLANALVDACRARATSNAPNLVTLSGGIDSRMVAAALRRAGVATRAVTHSDVHGVAERDVTLARDVSEHLCMPWELITLRPATGREMTALLRMKYGANYLGMSYVLPFFARLAEQHGRGSVLFTGDGGDKVLVDQRPLVRLRDDAALVDYILRREAILSADIVARITGVDRHEIAAGIRQRVASYPEETAEQRYVHFMFAERATKFLFEGEDRNRYYLWTVTPFYAPAVFELAMSIPDERKAQHRIRGEVLRLVGPEVADLVNASTGYPLADTGFRRRDWFEARVKGLLYRTLTPALELRIRRRMNSPRGYGEQSGALRAVRALVRSCPAVRDYLDPDAVEQLLEDAGGYRREQFSVLLTVAALVDELAQGGRALAFLEDVAFD